MELTEYVFLLTFDTRPSQAAGSVVLLLNTSQNSPTSSLSGSSPNFTGTVSGDTFSISTSSVSPLSYATLILLPLAFFTNVAGQYMPPYSVRSSSSVGAHHTRTC